MAVVDSRPGSRNAPPADQPRLLVTLLALVALVAPVTLVAPSGPGGPCGPRGPGCSVGPGGGHSWPGSRSAPPTHGQPQILAEPSSSCPPAGRGCCWRGTARTEAPPRHWPFPPRWQSCREAGPQALPPTSSSRKSQTSVFVWIFAPAASRSCFKAPLLLYHAHLPWPW